MTLPFYSHNAREPVETWQRFSRQNPCPICTGGHDMDRGVGDRCHGFESSDGRFAFCSREEMAGDLDVAGDSDAYRHVLEGECGCGDRHDGQAITEPPSRIGTPPVANDDSDDDLRTSKTNIAGSPQPNDDSDDDDGGAGSRSGNSSSMAATYAYRNAQGAVLFEVVRYRPKKFKQRQPGSKGGYEWNLKGVTPVLYRLPELLASDPAAPVFVTEGEKDADNVAALGLIATTSPGGAKKWKSDYNKPLKGRHVVVLPDNDKAGKDHARKVATSLCGIAASVKVLKLPGLPPKGDVSDWIDCGGTKQALVDLAASAPEFSGNPDTKARKPSAAAMLLALASDMELFHSSHGTPYASLVVNGHRETWEVGSAALSQHLRRTSFHRGNAVPPTQTMTEVVEHLKARALFDGPEREVHLRVAGDEHRVVLDLANGEWQAVEITPSGWHVIDNPSTRFRRTRGMSALRVPVRGGCLDELREFLNLHAEADWRLVVAWLTAALLPRGPYPILVISGAMGTAKSTATRLLRACVDPNLAAARALPRNEQELMLSANNGWMLGFDNVSHVPPWLSDALCRIATGGGFSARRLYTDSDETIYNVQRPVILNGMGDLVTRSDILERVLLLQLSPIDPRRRKTERQLWSEFADAQPRILGALLDAVAGGLRELPDVTLAELPRMADFAMWGTAVSRALCWGTEGFAAAYADNRGTTSRLALDSSVIAEPLVTFAQAINGRWTGTVTELLEKLAGEVDEATRRSRAWPTSRRLRGVLERLAPDLQGAGVIVNTSAPRTATGRLIEISFEPRSQGVSDQVRTTSSLSSSSSFLNEVGVLKDDGICDDDDGREAAPRVATAMPTGEDTHAAAGCARCKAAPGQPCEEKRHRRRRQPKRRVAAPMNPVRPEMPARPTGSNGALSVSRHELLLDEVRQLATGPGSA